MGNQLMKIGFVQVLCAMISPLKVSWTEFLFNDWITALRIILYACSFLFSMWQYIWITRIIKNLLWLLWTSHVSAKPFWSTCINGNISAGLLFLLLESDFKVEMLRVRSLTLIKPSCAVRFSHLKVFWTHFFFFTSYFMGKLSVSTGQD